MNIPDIEKQWIDNFKKSRLVNPETNTFQKEIAYQLFYGKTTASYPENYPDNFSKLYINNSYEDKETDIDSLTDFLDFIGIKINKESIHKHLQQSPADYARIFKKAHDIFKTLAHYGERLDIDNPFADNANDLYFFLQMEVGPGASPKLHGKGKGWQRNLFEETELPVLYKKMTQLPAGYEEDSVITNLFREIENSGKSFFITGKAGTGKSTFIHYLAQKTGKKVIMMAFTGIAAINVGGQTIHSFFKFPFKPLMPQDHEITLFGKNHQTRKIIEKIQIIVIDEVSMLRSDIMDGIDYSLRINGGNPKLPFGGKQMLFVGDVFQLPPVVDTNNEVEKIIFKEVYKSEYFFDANSYKKLNPVYFEFTKVHRQKDDLDFVTLLDKVRLCDVDDDTLSRFNRRHYPNYVPRIEEFVIFLTARNNIANTENAQKLEELNFSKFIFDADVTGEFKEDRYPTAKILELKKQAQVIFVKNDQGGRWVNGTIAKIEFISQDRVEIKLQNGDIHTLEKVKWENRKFKYDKSGGRIVSEVIGTFTQYPIKLAWAITIHKSQGLTFDKVVIDMGAGAFVNGQTYTALSRCRSLKGIALKKMLRREDIIADNRVINFHHTEQILNTLQE